jgi:hypothetical protein
MHALSRTEPRSGDRGPDRGKRSSITEFIDRSRPPIAAGDDYRLRGTIGDERLDHSLYSR